MHIHKRKIIPMGKTSKCIILPISWLRYNKLKDGDQVEIISNGVVTIKPKGGVIND